MYTVVEGERGVVGDYDGDRDYRYDYDGDCDYDDGDGFLDLTCGVGD